MPRMVRRAAIAFSKLRSSFGLVGIDADPSTRLAYVRLVRQWPDVEIEALVRETASLYGRFNWGQTMIEQAAGEHLIQSLKNAGVGVVAIHSQKKIKDASQIQRTTAMDTVEMTECLRRLKLNGQIRFPRNPTPSARLLEAQLPFFSKHTTEAGSVDYYAQGQEPDDLVRALRMVCFAVRHILEGADPTPVGGPLLLPVGGPLQDDGPPDLESEVAAHVQGLMGAAAADAGSLGGGPRRRANNGWGGM